MFKTISLCETTLPRQLGTNYRNFLYSLDFYSCYMLVPLPGNSSMHMCNETQKEKRERERKREKKKAIMLFLVICNYQHLVRMPVWVLILNEKIKAKEVNILFKITTFLNQSTYSFAFKTWHFLLQSYFASMSFEVLLYFLYTCHKDSFIYH